MSIAKRVSDDDESWRQAAACKGRDTEMFYPAVGYPGPAAAKAVCHGCAIRSQCLEYALANGERFGVWGGLSPQERRRLRRSRATG